MGTQMQLDQGFIWKEITWPPGVLERKKLSFWAFFYVYNNVYNRERELERVIEIKGDEFCGKKNMEIQSGCGKMRNASASKVKMSGSEK